MNIGIDIRCLMDRERSGVGEYAYQFLDNLFQKNYEQKLGNEYFLFWNSWRDVSANIPKWNYSFVHYCGFRWPNKLFNSSLRFLGYPKLDKLIERQFGRRRIKNPELIIQRFIFPNQNFYAFSRGVKKVVIVHDLSPELYPECFSLKTRLWHKFVDLRKMTRDADEIIAVSENTKFDLINLYKIEPAKIRVVYPKLPEPSFTYSHELENSSGGQTKGNYILFLGTIEPRKNVLGLLKAYELFVEAKLRQTPELWIAGKVGYKSKEVFYYWKKMRAKDRVKFLGYVFEEEKWKLYRGARIFVYPSLYEGFGLPVLEAQSCGTPVITSLTSSMYEVVKENGLLVDPNRVEDLAEIMKIIITN